MKSEDEEIFKQWLKTTFERRKQEDKIKRKQEVQKMRQQYLADGGEEFFEIKWSYEITNHQILLMLPYTMNRFFHFK